MIFPLRLECRFGASHVNQFSPGKRVIKARNDTEDQQTHIPSEYVNNQIAVFPPVLVFVFWAVCKDFKCNKTARHGGESR